MGSRYGLRVLLALFPACVTCLGNYEGSMPTANAQRVSTSTFPVNVPEVGSQNDPAYSSAHGSYIFHKGRLVAGSNIKSDLKDCPTPAERDNQENMINFKPSVSVPKYDLSGFGSRTATDAFKNVQPSSRLASTSYQGGSTLRVPEPKPLKPSKGEYSYTGTSGPQHGLSKGTQSTNKVQTASSSYGPLLKRTPLYSSINPRKLFSSEVRSSVVSSGPIFVVQGGSAQGHGADRGRLDSFPSLDDPHQASQTSTDLTTSNQGTSRNEPLHYSKSGPPSSPELRKPSKHDCRDNDRSSITSSKNELPPHYEATLPKSQLAYDFHGQNYKPTYPSQSWAQHNVPKSSIVSSGAIRIMHSPTNVQSTPQSNKPKVYPGFSFSSVPGTSYKPNSRPLKSELGFSATNPNIAGANKINTVHVRLNKPPTSSFGNLQNRGASGGAFQSSFPPCSVGQRQGQNVHTPIGSSQYLGFKEVQSQFTASQGNPDYTRHINAILSEFGQGSFRRILSSNYRQAEQNQPQVNRLDPTAPKYEVTRNSPAGPGQQGRVKP